MTLQQKQYAALSASALFLYCSYALARLPIIPLYAQSLGASPQLVGWAVGASTMTGVLMKLPAGAISDVIGRRRLLLAGAIVFALAPFFYTFATGVMILILLRFIHGNATALFGPTASAFISDISQPQERGIRLGLYSSFQGIGQAIGPVIGGWLITLAGFSIAFSVSGYIGVAGLLLLLLLIRDTDKSEGRADRASFTAGLGEVFRNRSIIVTSCAVAAMMLAVGAYNGFLPLYASEFVGLDASRIGTIFGVQVVTALMTRPLMGRLSDRVGRKNLILVALFSVALMISVLPLVETFQVLLAFGFLWGLCTATVTSVAMAFITDLANREQYGSAHGAYGTIFDIGEATGPVLAGVLVGWLGYGWMFPLMGVAILGFSLVFLLARITPQASPQ